MKLCTWWFRRRAQYFRRYSIGHCEKKNSWERMSNPEYLPRYSYLNLHLRKVLWMVTKIAITYCSFYFNFNVMLKWPVCYTERTGWLQFAIYVRKSHHQPQCTSQIVCENRVFYVWVEVHFSLCRQQDPKRERTIRLMHSPFFCKLRSSSNPTKKF